MAAQLQLLLPGIFHISFRHVICEDFAKLLGLFGRHQSAGHHGHQILWKQSLPSFPSWKGTEPVLAQILETLHLVEISHEVRLHWRSSQMQVALVHPEEVVSIHLTQLIHPADRTSHSFEHLFGPRRDNFIFCSVKPA